MSDPIVITYHDVTLHQSDVGLLDGSNWLNDNLIAYYFEYLTYEVFKDFQNDVAFIHPSTMFLSTFMESANELKEALSALKLSSKKYVFMPINDNSNISRGGGSHWSLLVYVRALNEFHYYDSYSTHNLTSAKRTADKFWHLLETTSKPPVNEMKSPQQNNGSDCGVYVLQFSETLANIHLKGSTSSLTIEATPQSITALRSKIKNQILGQVVSKKNVSLFSLKKKPTSQ